MSLRSAICAVVWVLLFAAGLPALADPPAAAPLDGVLVLRNGHVLSGRITYAGDRYVISQGEGSELRLAVAEVELIARSLEDAYWKKATFIDPRSVREHLELAEWCLRCELWGHASREILEAKILDSGDRRIAPLEARLLRSAQPTANAPTVTEPTAPTTVPSEPRISQQELDEMTARLPAAAVENFTLRVQPLLLNRCATAGCHGGSSGGGLRLTKSPWGPVITRRLTQQNLHAVLEFVDRAQPGQSRLSNTPRSPHGTATGPIFGPHEQRQYELLVAWISQVSGASAIPPAEATDPDSPPLLPTVAAKPLVPEGHDIAPVAEGVVPASAASDTIPPADFPRQPPLPAGDPRLHSSPAVPGTIPARSPAKIGADNPAFVPRDSFDPEIFNRQFFGPSKP